MKKGLVAILGLMTVVFLSACNNKPVENLDVNNDVDTNVVVDTNDFEVENADTEIYTKTSLTIEDLNQIDEVLFPISYTYETYGYNDQEPAEVGEYVYPEDVDHSLLLPVHATMADRTVESSSIEDGMLYTIASLTLQDGSMVAVLYINDPVTLKYMQASVNDANGSTLYVFNY